MTRTSTVNTMRSTDADVAMPRNARKITTASTTTSRTFSLIDQPKASWKNCEKNVPVAPIPDGTHRM